MDSPSAKRTIEKMSSWKLNGDTLKVVDSYKYLGVETGEMRVGRWNAYLTRMYNKAQATLNLLLFKAGGSNGLHPGILKRLWMTDCRPILEYASELWEGSISKEWERKLESLQYRFCKAAIGLSGNPSAVAMRMEMGLETLKSRRTRLKLGYWGKLCRAKEDRLLSMIFRRKLAELDTGSTQSDGLMSFKRCLEGVGLKEEWTRRTASDKDTWTKVVDESCTAWATELERLAAGEKTSMKQYVDHSLRPDSGLATYLLDRSNIDGTRLLCAIRTGHVRLRERVAKENRLPISSALCLLCKDGEAENGEHFLHCPALAQGRKMFEDVISRSLPKCGPPGRAMLRELRVHGGLCTRLLLGGRMNWREEFMQNSKLLDQCGKAEWMLNKAIKNMLVNCWRLRAKLLGQIDKCESLGWKLVKDRKPSTVGKMNFISSLTATYAQRQFWRPWVPARRRNWKRSGKKGRSNFYAVITGRRGEVFYKWSDCVRSMAGMEGAEVKGFQTLQEACDMARLCAEAG